jgi:hypothetical protein
VVQSRLILSTQACDQDFQSVPPSQLVAVVAAAARAAVQAAAVDFSFLKRILPPCTLYGGIFLSFFPA